MSSDTNLSWKQITIIYQKWRKIEVYHKSLKQNTSMGRSPTKTIDMQANHFFASILAFIKLEKLTLRLGIGHFRLKAQLYLRGLKAMHYTLNRMAA